MSLSLRFDEFFQFFKYQFAAAEIRVLSELGQFQKIVKSMCVICVRDSTKALKASLCWIFFESTELCNLFLFFILQEDLAHWQTVFFIAAAVYAIGNVLYCLMASGEEQPWNRVEDSDTTSTANVGPIISAEDLIDNVYQVVELVNVS